MGMWHNYLRVFLRDLRRQKVSAGINVVGLALGLCVFLMIGLYVRDEYSWDRQWKNSDRIVRVINEVRVSVGNLYVPGISIMAGPRLQEFFPSEIEASARILTRGTRVFVAGEEFGEKVFMADPALLDIFDFEPVAGNLEEVFAAPNRIALSEETARRLFGSEPALGKTLSLTAEGTQDSQFEVMAIYRIPAGNGALLQEFANFSLLDERAVSPTQLNNWMGNNTRSYFLLREGVDPEAMVGRLDEFVQTQMQLPYKIPEGGKVTDEFRYRLQPIGDAHFHPTTGAEGGFQSTVNGFGLIAVFVLAISLANFVILNLARSVERQREVGVRKVAGALSSTLLAQFVFESLLLTGIALGLALVLLELALPVFARLMSTSLDLSLLPASLWFAMAALVLAVGAIGGLYPALVLSRQRPDRVLRPGGQSGTLGMQSLRKLLVGFQLLIATALIIATFVVYLQLTYARQRDPGFDAENVLALYVFDRTPGQIATLRNAVSALAGVEQVALASLTTNDSAGGGIHFTEKLSRGGGVESIEAHGYATGYDFFSIYNMRLLAGRLYTEALDSASQDALAADERPQFTFGRGGRLVINESTSRALGFANPAAAVGEVIEFAGRESSAEIIGVVADSQFSSLLAPTRNEIYELQTVASWYLTLKVRSEAMPTIAEDLQRIWREVVGIGQARVSFMENNVQQAFDREQREGRLLLGFSTLAVVVACLGLYGLVAFEARRRTKEIGIRNVLGGGFGSIVALFLAQFGKPVAWASLLACPVALWAMLRWLERFPYQIERWWLPFACVVAGLLVSLVVSLTVSATVFTAARSRPVLALRYE